MRTGCYPGSFDPLTVAHLAIADAAHAQCDLDRLDVVISRVALAKDAHQHDLTERVAIIRDATRDRPWLDVVVTDAQLLADIAAGYDLLVVGADKWAQVVDAAFYETDDARDAALARLPAIACAPRPGFDVPPAAIELIVPSWVGAVSSTAVRSGASHWLARRGTAPGTRQSPE